LAKYVTKQLQESFVTEAVSAAKFAVRALVTLCAGTLLLLSSAEDRDDLSQKAMAELDALINIDYRSVFSKIAIAKNSTAEAEVEALQTILREFGLQLSLSRGNLVYPEAAPEDPQFIANRISLARLDDIFSSINLLQGEVRNIRSSEQLIRQGLEGTRQQFETADAPVSVEFGVNGEGTSLSMSDGRKVLMRTVVKGRIDATDFSIPINLRKEFSQVPELAVLVAHQPDTGELLFLPVTKSFWPELRDRPAKEAYEYLARKEKPVEQTLNILGLQFPKQHVSWTVPLLVLGLSVYLWIYIRNIVTTDSDSYPWIHLMAGWEAALISVAIIGALPVLTLVWTTIATWHSSGWATKCIAALWGLASMYFLSRSLWMLPAVKNLLSRSGV
jgi:hypothetical protein